MKKVRPYSIDEKIISRLLEISGFDHEEAALRAKLVAEDLNWINFKEFNAFCGTYPMRDDRSGKIIPVHIPEYRFGPTGFSIHNAENATANKPQWFGGTGLDRGHLALLSRVSIAARQHIPQYWLRSKTLRESLRNPPQHLSTVEEVWWLDQWTNIQSVEMGYSLLKDSNTDVDWSLVLDKGRLRVNMEVKRILLDCMRHVRGLEFNRDWFSKFCATEVTPKFHVSKPDEVNILAISLFGEIDRQVQSVIGDWLSSGQTQIDGILIATREARRHSQFDHQLFTPKSRLIKNLLKPISSEDSRLAFALDVPISIPGLGLPL